MEVVKMSQRTKNRVLAWAQDSIDDTYHWGNGSAYLPEEDILLKKLNSDNEDMAFSSTESRILVIWMERALGGGLMMGEDQVIATRLLEACGKLGRADDENYKQIKKRLTQGL